jgi:peptidoglycan/LPS O-acetylase OafA/YrhL
MNRVYFKGLDALRFIAAFMVFASHVEQMKSYFGYPNFWPNHCSDFLGKLGVTVFFVLSGFLITYLLLEEVKRTGRIHLGDFYLRRMLRIWPLYFLILLLAFAVTPSVALLQAPVYSDDLMQGSTFEKLLLYIGMMPNVALTMGLAMPFAAVLWSVGVEEQFYAFWPFLLRKHRTMWALLWAIAAYLLVKAASIVIMDEGHGWLKSVGYYAATYLEITKVSCLAIGGLGACLLSAQSPLLKRLCTTPVQWISLILFAGLTAIQMVYDSYFINLLVYECLSVFLVVLILNMACNPAAVVQPDGRWLNFLGKRSYGFYVYHSFCIVVWMNLLRMWWPGAKGWGLNILCYGCSLPAAIALSCLSYTYIEKRFLSLKYRFTRIPSGDQ